MKFGSGSERNAWYEIDGKKLFRLSIPKRHGARGFGRQVQKHVFAQLRLSPEQYDDFITCKLTGPQYAELVPNLFPEVDAPKP